MVALLSLLRPLASPAAAQTSTDAPDVSTVPSSLVPTTTVSATTTTTISLVPAPTTTGPAAPWNLSVPGPPPPPVVVATPADIARANQLERQIAAQSAVLDVLAAQYDLAQQNVVATSAAFDLVEARLATARASADTSQARLDGTGATLRRAAVDAYVNLGSGSPSGPHALIATYVGGAAQTDAETALGKVLTQLVHHRQAQQRLQATESTLLNEEQQTSDASRGAKAAAALAQKAAQAAIAEQQVLLNTVSQVSGNLVLLVAAAHAAEAQAAFNRFRGAGGLNFVPSAALAAPSSRAPTATQAAVTQVGKPYIWGATGPDSFDCSGLVQWAWARVGVVLPRVAAAQQAWATSIPISQIAPGDLVFFGHPAHHVGMYVGDGLMVDAPHSGASVAIAPIWWDDLAGFGRVHQP